MTTPETIIPETELSLPPQDPPRDWYFTFGSGHRIFAQHESDTSNSAPIQGSGFPVDGWYVTIHGDYHSARARMYALFGPVWSFQYARLPPIADLPGAPEWRELARIPLTENENSDRAH